LIGLVFILGVYMSLFIEVCIAYQLYSSINTTRQWDVVKFMNGMRYVQIN
jgi:hypothetical protein